MKKIIYLFAFTLLTNVGYSQFPNGFELDQDCDTTNDEEIIDGKYTKYQGELSSKVAELNSICGCYNKEGTNDFLVIIDETEAYRMYHSIGADGGCGASTSYVLYGSLQNFMGNCVLENFNRPFGPDDSCLFPTFTPDPEPVPTLSEWGLITLMLSFLIVGLVAVRQKKVSTVVTE